MRASEYAQNQKRCISETENRYTWRTTRAFPGHAEMKVEEQNLSSNLDWSDITKTTRKSSFFNYGDKQNKTNPNKQKSQPAIKQER